MSEHHDQHSPKQRDCSNRLCKPSRDSCDERHRQSWETKHDSAQTAKSIAITTLNVLKALPLSLRADSGLKVTQAQH